MEVYLVGYLDKYFILLVSNSQYSMSAWMKKAFFGMVQVNVLWVFAVGTLMCTPVCACCESSGVCFGLYFLWDIWCLFLRVLTVSHLASSPVCAYSKSSDVCSCVMLTMSHLVCLLSFFHVAFCPFFYIPERGSK